ncbi:MAG: hypothetical protein HYV07_07190 [Deltaproteobacteria bacterium]|nr:hypothetical protein [Deltaproteobacteria bacterium]
MSFSLRRIFLPALGVLGLGVLFSATVAPLEGATTAILGRYTHRWFLVNVASTALWAWLSWVHVFRVRRSARFGVGVFVASSLTVIGAGELASVAGVSFVELLGRRRGLGREVTSRPLTHWVGELPQDLEVAYGVDAPRLRFDFRTDRFGLRNAGDHSGARIVLLGDSLLVGVATPSGEILSERLGELLGQGVLNVSEVGNGPADSLARLEGLGIGLEKRFFVQLVFEGNDLADHARWVRTHAPSSHVWRGAELLTKSAWPDRGLTKAVLGWLEWPKPGLAARRAGRCRDGLGEDQTVHFFFDPKLVERDLEMLPRLAGMLADAHAAFAERQSGYAVVFIPTKLSALAHRCSFSKGSDFFAGGPMRSRFGPLLESLLTARGVPFLDLTLALARAADRGPLPYFSSDTHFTAAGHASAATAVAELLRGIGALD